MDTTEVVKRGCLRRGGETKLIANSSSRPVDFTSYSCESEGDIQLVQSPEDGTNRSNSNDFSQKLMDKPNLQKVMSHTSTTIELENEGVQKTSETTVALIPDFAAARQNLVRYKCNSCGRICPNKHKLKRHLSTHSEERPFPCGICGRSFKWTEYLQKHMRQQHSVTTKVEAEKSLSPVVTKRNKSSKKPSNEVTALFDIKKSSQSNDSEVQVNQSDLSDGDRDDSLTIDNKISIALENGPTKHSVSVGVDMDSEELDSKDSLEALMEPDGNIDFPNTYEVNASLYEPKSGHEIINPSDFVYQQQQSCFTSQTTEYSSLQPVVPPSIASVYQSNIQYTQSTIANSSQFEAACSMLNSNGLSTNPQVDMSNNHAVSSVPLEYNMCDYDSPLVKMSDFNVVSHSGCTNLAMSNSYCNKYPANCNSLQIDYSLNPDASMQTCTYDSSLHSLGHAAQLSNSIQPMYDSTDNLCTPFVYHTGQNQFCCHNPFHADRNVLTNCYEDAKDHMDLSAVSISSQQSELSSFNNKLHVLQNMEGVSVDDTLNLESVQNFCQSEGDNVGGIDIGIQCELGPETLQALIIDDVDDDDDEDDDAEVAGLRETEPPHDCLTTEELDDNSSFELKDDVTPTCDTIRRLLTDDRHVQKYPCRAPNCSKAYIHKKDVIRHMKIRHGITPQNLEAVLVETPEKPHICGVGHCRRSYFHLKDLKRHRRLSHHVSLCTSREEKHNSQDDLIDSEDVCHKYQMRFPCDFSGCLRSYVHKKDLVRHKRLYHNDATTKPSIPVAVKYSENELKHIRQRVKQEVDTKVEKIRLDSTSSNASVSTGSDEENVICVSCDDTLSSETKCTILLSSSSSLQNVKSGMDLSSTITGDLASLLGVIEQQHDQQIFRNC